MRLAVFAGRSRGVVRWNGAGIDPVPLTTRFVVTEPIFALGVWAPVCRRLAGRVRYHEVLPDLTAYPL